MPRFQIGKLIITNGIQNIINEDPSFQYELVNYLNRYLNEDWGILCDSDKQMNEAAIKTNERILASYDTTKGNIYVITERDRSCTTILLRNEY